MNTKEVCASEEPILSSRGKVENDRAQLKLCSQRALSPKAITPTWSLQGFLFARPTDLKAASTRSLAGSLRSILPDWSSAIMMVRCFCAAQAWGTSKNGIKTSATTDSSIVRLRMGDLKVR